MPGILPRNEDELPDSDMDDFLEKWNSPDRPTPSPEDDPVEVPLTDSDYDRIYKKSLEKPKIEQGSNIGSCYFVLALSSLHELPLFPEFIRRCVFKTSNGWRVKFWGTDVSIDVSEADIVSANKVIKRKLQEFDDEEEIVVGHTKSPNLVDRILEIAYARLLRIKKPKHAAMQTMALLDRGGFSHHVLRDFLGDLVDKDPWYQSISPKEEMHTMGFGLKADQTLDDSPETSHIWQFLQRQFQSPESVLLTAATPPRGPYKAGANGFVHERDRKGEDEFGSSKTYMDPAGIFVARHAYGVKVESIDRDAFDRKDYVHAAQLLITNPWDTSKEYRVNFDEFLKYFALISPVHVLTNSPTERSDLLQGEVHEKSYQDLGNPFHVKFGMDATLTFYRLGSQWYVYDQVSKKSISLQDGQDHLFGRAYEATLRIDRPSVSRRHFIVRVNRDRIDFKNVGTYGTKIETSLRPRISLVEKIEKIVKKDINDLLGLGPMKKIEMKEQDPIRHIPAECMPAILGNRHSSGPDDQQVVEDNYFKIEKAPTGWLITNLTDAPDLKGSQYVVNPVDFGRPLVFGRGNEVIRPLSSRAPSFSRQHFSVTFSANAFDVRSLSKVRPTELWFTEQKSAPLPPTPRPQPQPSPQPAPQPGPYKFDLDNPEVFSGRVLSDQISIDKFTDVFIQDMTEVYRSAYQKNPAVSMAQLMELARSHFENLERGLFLTEDACILLLQTNGGEIAIYDHESMTQTALAILKDQVISRFISSLYGQKR